MKKWRGLWTILAIVLLCSAVGWGVLRATAESPQLGEPVSYAVNHIDGLSLEITELKWSPFTGYSFHWKVTADTPKVYRFISAERGFDYLERCVDGRWYRLAYTEENYGFNTVEFAVGGDTTGFEGSVVQKYNDYGTRLEDGLYRLTLETIAPDGSLCYLAHEFTIE